MDLALVVLIALGVGIVLGWLGATHVHSVASAAARATTIPSGDVATLNAKIDGLGTQLQKAVSAVATPAITAAVDSTAPKA